MILARAIIHLEIVLQVYNMGRRSRKRSRQQSIDVVASSNLSIGVITNEDDKIQQRQVVETRHRDCASLYEYNHGNCYSDIIQFGLSKCKDNEKPVANWLNEIYILNKSKSDPSSKSTLKSVQSSSLQDEIKILSQELNSIKSLLWPTAIQTSQCKNKVFKNKRIKIGSDDTHKNRYKTTTPSIEFHVAREKCNPFELLSKERWIKSDCSSSSSFTPFLCSRSAMKLANIDCILDFKLTTMSDIDESSLPLLSSSAFKFVDLCGSPGGFSEYIFRRCNQRNCFGYGMSLNGTNDDGCGIRWDMNTLNQLVATQNSDDRKMDNKSCWKICNGKDGTGDVYNWDNILELQNEIWNDHEQSNNHNNHYKKRRKEDNDDWKVNLVVSDGGFDAQRDSECQESLAHSLVTCQTAASLLLLKKGGHFVIKMFGFQSSKKLMRHLSNSFEEIVILKPIASRPASAERYVICLNYYGLSNKSSSSFDLLSWRNDIIDSLGKSSVKTNSIIDSILDDIDLNMLQLNVEACSAIISHLHKEKQSMMECNKKDDEGREISHEEISNANDIDYSIYQKYFDITF